MIRFTTPNTITIWAKAVQSLPEEPFTFVLNAAHDTLPHNANLHLWRKKASDICPLCHEDSQNLIHVLNSCRVALEWRHYNERHDSVLTVLHDTIAKHLTATTSSTMDLANQYSFPSHIVPTELRPDIVWWDDTNKSVCLVELTVCFDTLLHEAAGRKESEYLELLSTIKEAGYRARSQLRWDHVACLTYQALRNWNMNSSLPVLRQVTLRSRQLRKQSLDLSVSGVAETEPDFIYLFLFFFCPVYHELLIILCVAWNQVIVQCFCRAL